MKDLQKIALITIIIIITINIVVTLNYLCLDLHDFWVSSDLIEKRHVRPDIEWVNQEILLLR